MASLPPVLALYIDVISPCLDFIVIGTVCAAFLIPLLIALLYFSTPTLRRQPIFLMNMLSVSVGIVFNFSLAGLCVHLIRHPEGQINSGPVLAVISSALLLPVFIDVILAFRLYAVLPSHLTPKLVLYAVFVPLALFKVARLINIVIFIRRFLSLVHSRNPALVLGSNFKHFNPNHKIEWFLLVLDNCYASGFFLWKIGMGRSAKSSGIVSNAKDTLKQLFYLAAASFVFPCMLGIGQLVFAFKGKGKYAIYIFFANVNVEIVCSLLATLWSAQTRWTERRVLQNSEASRISSLKFTSRSRHSGTMSSPETTSAGSAERGIQEPSVDTSGVDSEIWEHSKG